MILMNPADCTILVPLIATTALGRQDETIQVLCGMVEGAVRPLPRRRDYGADASDTASDRILGRSGVGARNERRGSESGNPERDRGPTP